MKKDNIFSIVTMSCGLLIIVSVFLPYVTYFSTSVSLWKMQDPSRFIYILLGLLVICLYLVNKKTELSYLTAGYGVFTAISNIIALQGLDGLSIGFYLILLSSLVIGVLTFLYDEKEAIALVNVNKPVMDNNSQSEINNQIQNLEPVNNPQQNEALRFDPITGEPIYQKENNN